MKKNPWQAKAEVRLEVKTDWSLSWMQMCLSQKAWQNDMKYFVNGGGGSISGDIVGSWWI